ncbi:BTAD domain-containing putative transcriptional regulator [Streptomyces venezuelae]|uniref:BTAD domain-containing putative transcriptional regulator n=1 Tax=Streptomyces venezuelae TaxID=54571 RepID=UPI00379801B1
MRYRILGATEAYDDQGAPLSVGGQRLRALLAALALQANRTVTVGALIEEVWAGDPPADAPAALQALVGRLRRAVGKDAVVSAPGGYRLAVAPDDVDLHRFERLAREGGAALDRGDPAVAARTLRDALALWRGPALADLPDRATAARPEAQRAEAVRARIAADLALGRAPEVVPELRELTSAQPYDEALRALLIRALRDAGRGADALAAYEETRRALADGLGTDPGPELRALHAELLAGPNLHRPERAGRGWQSAGRGQEPAGQGQWSAGRGQEPAGQGQWSAGRGQDPAGQGQWSAARSRKAAGHGQDAAGRGQDAAGWSQNAEGPGQGSQGQGQNSAGHGQNSAGWGQSHAGQDRNSAGQTQNSAGHGQNPAGPDRNSAGHGQIPAGKGQNPAGQAQNPQGQGRNPADHGQNSAGHDQNPADQTQNPANQPQKPAGQAQGGPAPQSSEEQQPPQPQRVGRAEQHGNIRTRLTSFVGREPELDAIRSDLRRARLVTLTGPGGSGKTRLAEEAAAGHPQAWLAELAPLDHPEAVPGAVVSALDLRETVLMTSELTTSQDDPVALLVEYCAPRSLLLLLDNCEHVIGAAAELAETLLTHCPGLTILATSREPLGVPGEAVRPVEPLPPDPAHRLFTERAVAVRPGFDPAADADAVAEICRRLDGLPLAIELAAARLRMLTPRQIADRLDDRFRLLTSGSRTVLPRQQTLRAVVDWSWELLDEAERAVLREASVFAGGWDLPAAEAVCTAPATDLIGALVDKSLVVAVPSASPGGGMRYRLLETIHEYATERAAETPALLAAAEARHSAYFRDLVARAEPLLRSAEQLPWISRLETDLDNIRAALQRTAATGDKAGAIDMALNTGWFWWLRNYRREGADWMARVLELAPPGLPAEDDPLYWPWMRLKLLYLCLVAESRPADSPAHHEEWADPTLVDGLRAAFSQPLPETARFPGLLWPFTIFFTGGTHEDALAPLNRTVENCRRHGEDWDLGVTLMFRTHMAVDMPGNLSGVDEDLAELRELSRRVGDRWMRAQVCSAAGEAAMARSNHEEARVEYEEALRLAYEVGAFAESSFLLARLAEVAYREGDRAAAKKVLDEARQEADRYGVTDSRAFVRLLGALLALDEGDVGTARALCEASRAESEYGTPPPQFSVALSGMEARVAAAESGPAAGLPLVTGAVREAVESRCSEVIVASLVDGAAVLLGDLGDHARATRVLAAATALRNGNPRPHPEAVQADRVERAAVAALGPDAYERERAAGRALTPDEVLTELEHAAAAMDEQG